MIDGLKLTMTGEEIRALLEKRIEVHQRRAEHWDHEANRDVESQDEDHPLLPTHMCENESEEEEWRIEVLSFIRDHIVTSETYRLGERDLAFGELLPEKPGWMQQDEYEREHAVGFGLERVAREMRHLDFGAYADHHLPEMPGDPAASDVVTTSP